jgi:type I restriction enzyme S subunit
MIDGLKPYTDYQESGAHWLGQVPKHWSVMPNRAIFEEVKDRDHPKEEMLSVTITRGIVRQRALLADTSKKDSSNQNKSAYKLVQPNDIAYNKMRAWQGAIGVSDLRGIISPAYVVMRLRSSQVPRYLHYLYRTPQFAKEAERWSYGITSDMWSLRPEHFKMIYAALPPRDEQAAIVKFLDYANGKIERAIRAKRKLIGLLNEQKQAIIHRAVTRGLDPNVKLKPSGIPWLGDIPQHWEVVRNMALFAHRVEPGEAGLPVLQVSLRSGITAEDLDQFGRPKRLIADPKKYKRIQTGDVAYNTMRMWQGAVGVAPSDGLVSPAYVVLRPRRGTCSEFYDSLFHTEVYKQQVNRQSTGIVSDRNRLYWDSFKQMSNISLPRSEQDEIVLYIKAETLGLNSAVLRLEREIDLLREYRTTLTAEVVTGKLDVREASKRLPDQTDDPLPADESLDDLDDEITEEVEA